MNVPAVTSLMVAAQKLLPPPRLVITVVHELLGPESFGATIDAQPIAHCYKGKKVSLGSSGFLVTLRDFPPFLAFFSAGSLFALYSIRFRSKCGSFRYSSRELTREMGASFYRSDESFAVKREDLMCLRFGIGTLSRFCRILATPKNSTTFSACLQNRR